MNMKISALFLTAVMLAAASGCSESGKEYKINVRNITGVAISELYIVPETGGDMKNYLKENLDDKSEMEISLGKLTEEDVSEGFALDVYSAEDGTSCDFGMLMVKNGGTITFYLDAFGLAVAVDATDEEIQEEIEKMQEEAEATAEELTKAAE